MNNETTSLSELPVQPGTTGGVSGGGEAQNIVMTTNEAQSTTYSPNVPGVQQPAPNGERGPPQGAAPAGEPQPAGGSQIPPQQMSQFRLNSLQSLPLLFLGREPAAKLKSHSKTKVCQTSTKELEPSSTFSSQPIIFTTLT